ncbi:MAG: hypothetical protein ACU84Q_16290 [Gammaproteobacteria bacterium]
MGVITTERKVVRAADLSGLAAAYPDFLRHTTNLWHRQNLQYGPMTLENCIGQAQEMIRFYPEQEIRLRSYFSEKDRASAFPVAIESNLEKLVKEPNPRP